MRSTRIIVTGGLLAVVLAGIVLAQATDAGTELALVERVVKARDDYKASLTEVYNFYLRSGDMAKATRAERELAGLNTIEQYDYSKQTAGPVVQAPVKVLKYVPEADDYFADGKVFTASQFKAQKDLALKRFQKILDTWPESDKAPAAAFELGELYSGFFFRDYDLAEKYYKQCYDLDPATSLPALLKAGDMLNKVGRYKEAVEMYKLAVTGSRDVKVKEKAEARLRDLARKGY